jgi:hypothetical protein
MNPYRDQVEQAVRSVEILSPTAFSWMGKRSPRLLASVEHELTERTARAFLMYNLQSRLYDSFYCTGGAAPERDNRFMGGGGGAGLFTARLAEANTGCGYWDAGWEVVGVEGERVTAQRGGLEVIARRDECLPSGEGLVVGAPVSLRFPKSLPDISPGFYMAAGDTDMRSGGTVRLYWHVSPEGAVALMRRATEALNAAGVPFRLKAVDDPARYTRCDAAVLYIPAASYDAAAPLLSGVYAHVQAHLRARVPAFTRLLAPGLGLAEDPGDGDSFGMHRCRLLADALVTAYEQGAQSVEERVAAVLERFAGEDLDRPYLNPGSEYRYSFEVPALARPSRTRARSTPAGDDAEPGPDLYLEAAHAIGRRIAAGAVWHEGMCNWLAADPASGRADSTEPLTYRSLDAGLYSGTAGVALFLAELCLRTGDNDVRSTALGAARLALARADDIQPAMRPALYSGALGVALAVARAGLLLGADDLVRGARELSASVVSGDLADTGRPHDMLSGSAGGILACLALGAMLSDGYLEEFAGRLARGVLDAGRSARGRRSWPSFGFTTYGHLTGFSHGAAGIATALLEWWRVSGDLKYRRAADEAFAYEQSRFHPGLGNWPDLREPSALGFGGRRVYTYQAFWCHGAPGIALSRLHAFALTADPERRAEAAAALETTRRAVAADLDGAAPPFCLCHGLPGNADVLAHAPLLDPAAPPPAEAARATTRVARHYLAARDNPPSPSLFGAPDDHPSLMLGHAGSGYALLRCLPAPPPSVLLVQPHEWRPGR